MLLELNGILVGIVLGIQGCIDIKNKEIPLGITIVGGIVGMLISIYEKRSFLDILLALMAGIVFLIIGRISREAVGYGDGMLIGMLGMFYSLKEVLSICFIAFLFAGIAALILFLFFHRKGSYEIPFVPFLFLGWSIQVLI